MMLGAVWIDGELQRAGDARVSVFDRGFLYGDSAFEVMRTYDKRPFREQAHLDRLRARHGHARCRPDEPGSLSGE
mgnify:CR=1 FL=1